MKMDAERFAKWLRIPNGTDEEREMRAGIASSRRAVVDSLPAYAEGRIHKLVYESTAATD